MQLTIFSNVLKGFTCSHQEDSEMILKGLVYNILASIITVSKYKLIQLILLWFYIWYSARRATVVSEKIETSQIISETVVAISIKK